MSILNQPVTYLIHCIVENGMPEAGYWMLDAGLSSIQYRDIAAIAKELDAKSAGELVRACSESPDAGQSETCSYSKGLLRNWLAAYQETNIDIFQHFTMLPLRFGIMVDEKEEIEDFLSNSYIHLKWALDRLRGRAELAVQLSWDLNVVLQEISHDRQFKSQIENQKSKMLIGRLLFEAVDIKKKEIVESVHDKLIAVSLDSSEGRSANGTERDFHPTIMNRSYLIEKTAEGAFDQAMVELARENESYLSFKYAGPMPPYSFAPLEFRRGNFQLIDRARRTLSLPERARFEDIKSSYRELSLEYHPDKNPDDQRASERFKEINEAYKILETYCYSCEGCLASGETQAIPAYAGTSYSRENATYSFAKEDVEAVFIVERALAR